MLCEESGKTLKVLGSLGKKIGSQVKHYINYKRFFMAYHYVHIVGHAYKVLKIY